MLREIALIIINSLTNLPSKRISCCFFIILEFFDREYLLTGTEGYIGDHCTLELTPLGHSLFGLDFCKPKDGSLFQRFDVGDHGTIAFIQSIFKEERIECIIHASGSSNVMETVADPMKYYGNDLMEPYSSSERLWKTL
jgi:UDP-glucose 4-epimerase